MLKIVYDSIVEHQLPPFLDIAVEVFLNPVSTVLRVA